MRRTVLAAGVGAEVFFSESFNNLDNWVQSKWKGDKMGMFDLYEGAVHADKDDDMSLATRVNNRFYAASAHFTPFSNKDKTIVIQYQVKYEQDVECGGGYFKLGPKMDDPEQFGDPTPYYIMFGPDKCGYTSRTHLIFSKDGKNVLKTADLPYKQSKDHEPTVYRLTLTTPEGKVKVEVNGEEVYAGSIVSDWEMLPPQKIDDPSDVKPDDWVEQEMMDDPDATKPADWMDGPKEIPDPVAKKPEDWDDDEDGEWEPKMIDNPAYKGEWQPPKIENPAYKGPWSPKKIDNPAYKPDEATYLGAFDDIAFIGFDLWQVKSGTMFDNIIITDDVAEADALLDKWKRLQKVEKPAPKEDDLDLDDDADKSGKDVESDDDEEDL